MTAQLLKVLAIVVVVALLAAGDTVSPVFAASTATTTTAIMLLLQLTGGRSRSFLMLSVNMRLSVAAGNKHIKSRSNSSTSNVPKQATEAV